MHRGHMVVAKSPANLLAVTAYGLSQDIVLGPWTGSLSNEGETIRLRNSAREVVEEVTYAPAFPWPGSANALGAGPDWTGLSELDYQYRGRSLERVGFAVSSSDPANWLASPIPGNPSRAHRIINRETPNLSWRSPGFTSQQRPQPDSRE
jgi:hypothetical protein